MIDKLLSEISRGRESVKTCRRCYVCVRRPDGCCIRVQSARVCPCVYGGSRVCRRDLRFSALLSCHPVQVAGSQLRWGFSANLRPAGRDGTFWSEWGRGLCGRPPRLLEVKNLRVLVPILAVRGGRGPGTALAVRQ